MRAPQFRAMRALSKVEGRILSKVEGRILSKVEGAAPLT
jgi:hypothetical protein